MVKIRRCSGAWNRGRKAGRNHLENDTHDRNREEISENTGEGGQSLVERKGSGEGLMGKKKMRDPARKPTQG